MRPKQYQKYLASVNPWDDLMDDIMEKNQRSHKATVKKYGINIREYAITNRYTGDFYKDLNKSIRLNNATTAQRQYEAALNHIIGKLPQFEGTTWRGVRIDKNDDRFIKSLEQAFKEGKEWMDDAFISTSYGRSFSGPKSN